MSGGIQRRSPEDQSRPFTTPSDFTIWYDETPPQDRKYKFLTPQAYTNWYNSYWNKRSRPGVKRDTEAILEDAIDESMDEVVDNLIEERVEEYVKEYVPKNKAPRKSVPSREDESDSPTWELEEVFEPVAARTRAKEKVEEQD